MCGIFGAVLAEGIKPGNLALMAVEGLLALQHRGTEGSGLIGSDGNSKGHFKVIKNCGLIIEVFKEKEVQKLNDCVVLLGHNRYSTAGMKDAINCLQPFLVYTMVGPIAIAHNGELVDAQQQRKIVLKSGVALSTDTDSELIAQLLSMSIAKNAENLVNGSNFADISQEIANMMKKLYLSYSLIVMTFDRLYALRDPYGNRPICVAKIFAKEKPDLMENPIAYFVASESCAFPSTAQSLYELKPGEIMEISRKGIRCIQQIKPAAPSFCIFEYVYFARADSILEGQQVYSVRKECGRILADEVNIKGDIVSNVPDSAVAASLGFAEKSGIKYMEVLHRNSYIGRSFIQPSTELRKNSILRKFGVIRKNVAGKKIILIDDSIVRGNTMGIIVHLLKEYGAKEVHVCIASPPIKFPCYMGINISSKEELIASTKTNEEIAKKLNADSVWYLSVEGLKKAITKGIHRKFDRKIGYCTACLTGQYPVDLNW